MSSVEPQLDDEIIQMAQENRARWRSPTDEQTVTDARVAYSERYRFRSLPAKSPIQVERLNLSGRATSIPARLYRPERLREQTLPLIVYFHGGGFVMGDADGYELQSMRLAEEVGCAVLFPEFRLAPEHAFPAAVHDAIDAFAWAIRHAGHLHIDTRRVVVMGDSAGGNLAANVCLAARDQDHLRIALQFLLYPVTDFRPYWGGPSYPSVEAFSSGYLLDRGVMEWFTRQYLPDAGLASDPLASPLLVKDVIGLPPTVIVTAACDPLRDMGKAFAQHLEQAGNEVEYVCEERLAHNFMGHVAGSARASRAFDSVVRILRRHLQ